MGYARSTLYHGAIGSVISACSKSWRAGTESKPLRHCWRPCRRFQHIGSIFIEWTWRYKRLPCPSWDVPLFPETLTANSKNGISSSNHWCTQVIHFTTFISIKIRRIVLQANADSYIIDHTIRLCNFRESTLCSLWCGYEDLNSTLSIKGHL